MYEELITKRKYAEAKEAILGLQEDERNSNEVIFTLCKVHIFLDEYDDAIALANNILLEDINNANAYFIIAISNKYLGNRDEAIRNYNMAFHLGFDSRMIWRNISSIYEADGDYENAIRYLDKIIKHYRNDIDSRLRKAKILIRKFILGPAVQIMDEIIYINPDFETAYEFKAKLVFALGYENAMKFCKESLKKFPENTGLKLVMARIKADQGDLEEALEGVDKILAEYDSNPNAMLVKGEIYMLQEYPEKAMSMFEQVYAFDNEIAGAEASFYLMSQYIINEDFDKALNIINNVVSSELVSPYYNTARYYKAVLLKKLKNPEYEQEFTELIKYFESLKEVERMSVLIYLAFLYIETGDCNKAEDIAQEIEGIKREAEEADLIRYLIARKNNDTDYVDMYLAKDKKSKAIRTITSILEVEND